MPNETCRCLRSNLKFAGIQLHQLLRWIIAKEVVPATGMADFWQHTDNRVAENTQVRARAFTFYRITGIQIALVRACQYAGCEMPARRRAHDPDVVRVKVPFFGSCPYIAHRSRAILKHHGMVITVR